MTLLQERVSLLRSPWTASFQRLLASAETNLLIVCPFVKRYATERIVAEFERRQVQESVTVRLITDLRPESSLAGSMDLGALCELGREIRGFELTHLPSVHAKVYVADEKMAIITSGNLTVPGLCGNVEYGVALQTPEVVGQIRSDLQGYGFLGAKVSLAEVAALAAEIEELKELYQQAQTSVRARARQAFREKLTSAHVRLLRQRATGKTTHAIFSDTIKFLLRKSSLRTEELHPLVQLLHPDLCDDSIDRVIDGVHFGKKWKHYVRNAQQFLKRNGEIEFNGSQWRLAPKEQSPS